MLFVRALDRISGALVDGANVLSDLALNGRSETVRLHAARSLLELGVRLRDSVDLDARLSVLEMMGDARYKEARRAQRR